MRSRTISFAVGAALAAALLLAPAAPARPVIGMGDQNPAMFTQPLFTQLHLGTARFFIRWDATGSPATMAQARAWLTAARAQHETTMVTISTSEYSSDAHLPTVAEYRSRVAALVRALRPLGVDYWGTWDEANHPTQPTSKHPAQVARYFVAMRGFCSGCRIVGLDVLDQTGVTSYVDRFYRALSAPERRAARIVGVNNYGDVNYRRTSGLTTILRAVRRHVSRPRVWLTQSGAIVSLGRRWPCDEARAADRMTYLFTILHQFSSVIDRVYLYNWFGTECSSEMDTGVVHADGSARPSYDVLRDQLAAWRRR
jgi:hypothetical protein